MSIITKFLFSLFLVVLPLQKTKVKCLIIALNDSNNSYRITNIGDPKNLYYLILEYPNISENKEKLKTPLSEDHDRKRKELNAVLSTGVEKQPTSTSYNLQNRNEIKSLPDSIKPCDCASLEDFNLGMDFKLYVEKEDGWVSFDAKKLRVEE
ncbi:hypothetical protein [Mesonia sp.]|uniref:hypothetical protein n=1 Tax=Mesonia sp. TaxID=1960830 RepID=UPI003F9D8A77